MVGPDRALYGSAGAGVDRIDTTTNTATTVFTLPAPVVSGRYSVIASMTADSGHLWLSVYDRTSSGTRYDRRMVRVNPANWATRTVPEPATTGSHDYVRLTSAGDYLYAVTGYQVVRITKGSGATEVIAGASTIGYADGTGAEAWFGAIAGLTSDGTFLYATDNTNTRIRTLA